MLASAIPRDGQITGEGNDRAGEPVLMVAATWELEALEIRFGVHQLGSRESRAAAGPHNHDLGVARPRG